MSRCENYMDDVPMRLSRKFEPFFLDLDPLPDVRSAESLVREFTYEFNTELCALEVADRRSAEICAEAERVRQKQLKQQELGLNHHLQSQGKTQLHQSSLTTHSSHCPVVPQSQFMLSMLQTPASLQTEFTSHSHAVTSTTTSASTVPLSVGHVPRGHLTPGVPLSGSAIPLSHSNSSFQPSAMSSSSSLLSSSFLQHQQQQPHHHSLPASPSSSRSDSQSHQTHSGSQLASNSTESIPIDLRGHFGTMSATPVSSASKSGVAEPAVMNGINSGAAAMVAIPVSAFTSENGPNAIDQKEQKVQMPLKAINTKEFEDFVGSSPFDDALLKSIDDRQELNSVFANVVHSANHSLPQNTFHGPNHTPFNNFNPR